MSISSGTQPTASVNEQRLREAALRNEAALRSLAKFLGLLLGCWLGWRYGVGNTRENTYFVGVPTLVGLQVAVVGAILGVGAGSLVFRLAKALWQHYRQSR